MRPACGRIASVYVGGSILSGKDTSGGTLTRCASIVAAQDIGSLTFKGSLVGTIDAGGSAPVFITAVGQAKHGAASDLAIGSIHIGGRVELAAVFAGYDSALPPKNADAQIGPITVGGDWLYSDFIAGVQNSVSGNQSFGNAHDAKIGGAGTTDLVGIVSKIASIAIGGQVIGLADGSTHFGFVAEQIGSFTVGRTAIPLHAGAHNDLRSLAVASTNDVAIHEI